uniref:Uncharacterized protein n=1 Tax=Callorhinchus milii TaxID=7868 RepID=A0A4W3GSB6_CALMI
CGQCVQCVWTVCVQCVCSIGSRDATLRLWDIESGRCLHTLLGHVAAVRCVQYDGRRVVSGAYDYTVKVWDPETETCVHTLQGHTNRVYSLQVPPALCGCVFLLCESVCVRERDCVCVCMRETVCV